MGVGVFVGVWMDGCWVMGGWVMGGRWVVGGLLVVGCLWDWLTAWGLLSVLRVDHAPNSRRPVCLRADSVGSLPFM